MFKIAIAFAFLGLSTATSFAQSGSSEISYDQLHLVWPNLTQARFRNADLDGSGGLNADELRTLQGATPVSGGMQPSASVRAPTDADYGIDSSSSGQSSATGQ